MHINHVKSKLAKSIAILYKVKDVLNQHALYILYCSIIVPYISYCLEIWGNAYPTHTKPIFTLQKGAEGSSQNQIPENHQMDYLLN